ncbi:MAG: hypothetical protein HY326_02625 [Chloroflexi bacterium]|nr:hypothetical protein [Chloroflexota bacterium]
MQDNSTLAEGDVFSKSIFHRPVYQAIAQTGILSTPSLEKVDRFLAAIDAEGMRRFNRFPPVRFPGVGIPYTGVSVKRAIAEICGELSDTFSPGLQAGGPETNIVILPGWSPPPGSHPFSGWNAVYHFAIKALPRKRQGDIKIYSVGLPSGFGGTVSGEWIKAIRQRGLTVYGEALAEFVENVVQPSQTGRLILTGTSLGGILASETAKCLEERTPRLMLWAPTGFHERGAFWRRCAQMIAGIGIETLLRSLFERDVQQAFREEEPFLRVLRQSLEEKGMAVVDDSAGLHIKAAVWDILNVMRGNALSQKDRCYIMEGGLDPVNASPRRIFRRMFQGIPFSTPHDGIAGDVNAPQHVTRFTAWQGTHTINLTRRRAVRWARILKAGLPG